MVSPKEGSIVSAWKPWQVVLLAAICGILLGGGTLLGQATLPGSWNHLANSGAVWLVPAFFLAALASRGRLAVVVGILTLYGELIGYYVSAAIFPKSTPTLFFLVLWGEIALVAGPLAGIAGHWWRGEHPSRRVAALAFLGGVFVAEGLYFFLIISDHLAGWGWIVIGTLLPLVCGRSTRDRLFALLVLPLLTLLGFVAYLVIAWFSLHPGP